eukprot:9480887-Pyramimonas_sp.AAC.1
MRKGRWKRTRSREQAFMGTGRREEGPGRLYGVPRRPQGGGLNSLALNSHALNSHALNSH